MRYLHFRDLSCFGVKVQDFVLQAALTSGRLRWRPTRARCPRLAAHPRGSPGSSGLWQQASSRSTPWTPRTKGSGRVRGRSLHNRDIDYLISVLQLGSLYALLNSLHGNLSLRHDRVIADLVGEL